MYTRDEVFNATLEYFNGDELSTNVFFKYILKDKEGNFLEKTPDDMHKRLAKEFARIEKKYENPMDEKYIYSLLRNFKYIVPQGSPMMGIGNQYSNVSLSNCFVPNTHVWTQSGSKEIQDVKIGDKVLTHKGNLKPVVQLHKNKVNNRQLYSISTYRTPEIKVTDNHRFWSLSREQQEWNLKPKWNPVSYLRKGDWIAIPKPKDGIFLSNIVIDSFEYFNQNTREDSIWYEISKTQSNIQLTSCWNNKDKICKKSHNTVNRFWNLDSELAFFIGLWYGDGCIFRQSKNKSRLRGITFTFNKKEVDLIDFVARKGEEVFGLIPDINYHNQDVDGTIQIVFHSTYVAQCFSNMFGRYFDGKKVFDKFYYLNTEVIEQLLAGLISSDGTITADGQGRVVLNNKHFIKELFLLLRTHGLAVGHSEVKRTKSARIDLCIGSELLKFIRKEYEDDRINKALSREYNYSVNKGNIAYRPFILEIDGQFFMQIKDKQLCNESHKYVYTLGIEDDHSYSVEGLICENCFVIASPDDNMSSIIDAGKNLANISKRRGGVGIDISTLRPDGAAVSNAAGTSSGAWSFADFFSNVGRMVGQNARRAALMIAMDIKHPDIEKFITMKHDLTKVTGANISVKISDDFMKSVQKDEDFELRFPVDSDNPKFTKKINARKIWNLIVDSATKTAEPGILMWDNITKNLPADLYVNAGFKTRCVNPCAELALSEWDSCRLISVNLKHFVNDPFTRAACFDENRFKEVVYAAQRLSDDLVDLELEKIQNLINVADTEDEKEMFRKIYSTCFNGRRTGLGTHGLADALSRLGLRYDSDRAIEEIDEIYDILKEEAYQASVDLASERGSFPVFNWEIEKDNLFIRSLSKSLQHGICEYGRRNISILTNAPTGSVSILSQTSSGIEPVFQLSYKRRKKRNHDEVPQDTDFVDKMGDRWTEFEVYHHNFKEWADKHMIEKTIDGGTFKRPDFFVTSSEIDWERRIDVQATIQKHIDHSISSTINLPRGTSPEVVGKLYQRGWEKGLKGITVYVDGSRDGVLITNSDEKEKNKFEYVNAPKRGEELECDIHNVSIKGERWIILVGLKDDKPYEVFGGLSENIEIPSKYKKGTIIKQNEKKTKPSRYDLQLNGLVIKDILKMFDNITYQVHTRMVSLALRHGAKPSFLVEQLQKDPDNDLTSFSKVLARVLKKYISDGTEVASGQKACQECGNDLTYNDGCISCNGCGWSKCG